MKITSPLKPIIYKLDYVDMYNTYTERSPVVHFTLPAPVLEFAFYLVDFRVRK